ncbi:MAG: class I tRNA ligase family protein [Patescibacteria group bacterium]|nr:class I tRNA ligase family protein [Patescibacteria group bacterium]
MTNYLSGLDFPDGEKFKKYWPADAHIIGADINKFHSIYWPALLMSAGIALPRKIFVHGLFTVNGQKMSKTLGNVIDPKVLIEKFGPDATRYLLLSQFPAFEHGDINENGFMEKYNADLANGVGNLFGRVFAMARRFEIKESGLDNEVVKIINETKEKYEKWMENFQLFEALKEVFVLVKFLDKYINEKQPWKSPENLPQILNSLLSGVEEIIVLLSPFMPQKMEAANDFLRFGLYK